MPCVYLPGPAPAVTVANMYICIYVYMCICIYVYIIRCARTVMCEEFDVHDAWLSNVRDGVDISVSLMK